jgi:two-component system chemotaxis sensor kinase CheA
MDEIIDDFVMEAEESLEKIDPMFLELETKGFDKEILNDIFRSMHTIKGAAGFLGFQSIIDVAHSTEGLMKNLRDGHLKVSSSLISLVLKSVDMIKLLLVHIKARDNQEEDISPLLEELDIVLKGGVPPVINGPPAETAVQSHDETGPEEYEAAELVAPESTEPADFVEQEAPEPVKTDVDAEKPVESSKAASIPKGGVQTLRVDVDRIDKVMNLTGEIVLVRNRLLNIVNFLESRYSTDEYVEGLQETVSFLDLVTSDIQLAVMKMRMLPIKKVFGKFPRLVRDISQGLGKDVQLSISGEETEVDRSVIERIGDPMVHIIRNAIGHGLEPPGERKAKGKPVKGIIDITAYQQGNQIMIEVADDGKGIDVEKVKLKALERSLITKEEVNKMTDKEAANLIFHAGFSTVDEVTELSGRGVGMDVVKMNISKLNGYVEIITTKNVGTTFRISIPLTLAIIQALMVRSGGVQYAIPLSPIEETLKIEDKDMDMVAGNKVLTVRDSVLPLTELTDMLGYHGGEAAQDYRYVLVMAIGDRRFCVGVDELLGQEEVVIKAIDGIDTDMTGILGATITGDGKIVLILDPSSISKVITGIASI